MIFERAKQEHRAKKTILADIAKAEKVAVGAESALGQIATALHTLKSAMALGDETASTDARAKLVDKQSEELKREASANALVDLRAELQAREQYDQLQSRLSDHQRSIDQAKLAVTDWKKKKGEAIKAMQLLNEISGEIEIYRFEPDSPQERTKIIHHITNDEVDKYHPMPARDRLINLTNALDREIKRLAKISESTPQELEYKNYA